MPRLTHLCFLLYAATSSLLFRKSESFFICKVLAWSELCTHTLG